MNELSEQQKQELHKELLDLRDELQKLLADSSDGCLLYTSPSPRD